MTTLTVATVNDDWASAGSNYADVADVDVVLIQEGRRARYATMVDPTTHGVLQSIAHPALAGSVIIWALAAVVQQKTGLTFGVKADGLLTRYLAWLRSTVAGRPVLFIAAHRPPKRAAKWWRPFDLALAARVRRAQLAGRYVIVGIDTNEHNHAALELLTGLVWHSTDDQRIDGFLMSKRIKVTALTALPKHTSDHQPLVATVEIPKVRKPKPPKPPVVVPPKPQPKPEPVANAAVAHCRNQSHHGPQFSGPNNGANQCRLQCRIALGKPSVGDFDGDGDADAEDAWKASKAKHPGDRKPPRGMGVFWGGGSHDNGHEAISAGEFDGVWHIWSTDILRPGFFDFVPLFLIEQKWGLTYLGWTEDQ